MFPVAEGGRKLTNDVGRSPESFGCSVHPRADGRNDLFSGDGNAVGGKLPEGRVLKGVAKRDGGSLYPIHVFA